MGLLVSGGSMASLTCLAAARYWVAKRDGWDVRQDGVGHAPAPLDYLSEQGHSSLRKSAEMLGLGAASLRPSPWTTTCGWMWRRSARWLQQTGRPACARSAWLPAPARSTPGAIDPLDALADVCAEEDLWLHVDGAYGGVGILDPALAPLLRGAGSGPLADAGSAQVALGAGRVRLRAGA